MASNDRIILDQILAEKRKEVAPTLTENQYFEIFSAEQILKEFDLSYEEIESGIVGDSGDGALTHYTCSQMEILSKMTPIYPV